MDTPISENQLPPVQPNKKIFGILIVVGVALVLVVGVIILLRQNKTNLPAANAPATPVQKSFPAVPSVLDTDHDTLADADEIQKHHTDPKKFDTDGDGLSDAQEVLVFKTDPNNARSIRPDLPDGVAIRLQPKK